MGPVQFIQTISSTDTTSPGLLDGTGKQMLNLMARSTSCGKWLFSGGAGPWPCTPVQVTSGGCRETNTKKQPELTHMRDVRTGGTHARKTHDSALIVHCAGALTIFCVLGNACWSGSREPYLVIWMTCLLHVNGHWVIGIASVPEASGFSEVCSPHKRRTRVRSPLESRSRSLHQFAKRDRAMPCWGVPGSCGYP